MQSLRCVSSIVIFSLGLAYAASAFAAEAELEIEGIRNNKGTVSASLCDEKTFLKSACFYRGRVPAREGKVVVRISGVVPGKYAAQVYPDENENAKLDIGSTGLPTEGYGFSNNAIGNLGLPKYAEAETIVDDERKTATIIISY